MKLQLRHLFWVNLALLAVVAYGAALTVSTAVAAWLMPPPEVKLKPPPPPISKEPHRPLSYYAVIQSRDVFNSTKPAAEKPPEPPKPSECKGKLWGVVKHTDPARSYAIIEDLTTHKQEVYPVGGAVPNCGSVKSVSWDKVMLDHDGRDEIMELQSMASLPGPVAGPGAAAPGVLGGGGGPRGGPAVPPPGAAGVPAGGSDPHFQQLSETDYNIDRGEVESALENMNQLFTQLRAVPHFDGGKAVGFRLFAIKQGSLFDKIGLRNGDIIQRINGNEINDAGKALELFQALRNERQLNVDIVRNKEPKTMNYRFM